MRGCANRCWRRAARTTANARSMRWSGKVAGCICILVPGETAHRAVNRLAAASGATCRSRSELVVLKPVHASGRECRVGNRSGNPDATTRPYATAVDGSSPGVSSPNDPERIHMEGCRPTRNRKVEGRSLRGLYEQPFHASALPVSVSLRNESHQRRLRHHTRNSEVSRPARIRIQQASAGSGLHEARTR